MADWSFLTNHARVLLCVARDPGVRLRDIAAGLGITERSAFGIISDLVVAGYVVKEKDGRRNRYNIQAHLPLPESAALNALSVRSWACWAVPARPAHDPNPVLARPLAGSVGCRGPLRPQWHRW